MAISVADLSGCFPSASSPFTSMPDPKKATSGKQRVWHRLWLPKWLLRDGRRSASPSRSTRHREWNFHRGKNKEIGGSLPQTPLTEIASVSRSSLSRVQVSDNSAYPAPTQRGSRRAVSADRGTSEDFYGTRSLTRVSTSQLSAPEAQWDTSGVSPSAPWFGNDFLRHTDRSDSRTFTESISGNDEDLKSIIERELDKKWILNLSLRFRNGSDREKFFVTYLETPHRWRRVTVTCDYGRAEPGSLEQDLRELPFQSDKNARIYGAIRDSIDQIQFFDTVTNLRLQTIDGQLHVNVTEDANEIIPYPPVSAVSHLNSLLIPETHLTFEGHFSGFAYQVKYNGMDYVKKEIPGPENVDEFLYEINALYELLFAQNVIQLKAIVVDDTCQLVKGLMIDFAAKGDLAGLLQDYEGQLQWERREKWAKQIVHGLAEIHEAGFVQGDLTLSNVVVDANDDAKIIDINRRGCPIGWEPPEFQPKLENRQRISMYIGVKSDLYQLGMILWAIATEVDQPERQSRPLTLPVDAAVPDYYRQVVQICLNPRPQRRLSAKELLRLFPEEHSSPPVESRSQDLEHFILGSSPNPHLDGAVRLDQIPRSYLDQSANNFPIVSASQYLDDQHADPRFDFPLFQNDLSIHSPTQDYQSGGETGTHSVKKFPTDEGNLIDDEGRRTEGFTTPAQGPSLDVVSAPRSPDSRPTSRDREIELETPPNTFSFPCPLHDSRTDPLFPLSQCPEDLTFIGYHPSCVLNTHSLDQNRARSVSLPRSNEIEQSRLNTSRRSETGTSDESVFEMAEENQESDANSVDQMCLLSSSLPTNPACTRNSPSERHSEADSPLQHSNVESSPEVRRSPPPRLRRVTPTTNLNDLFSSHLPINPRHEDGTIARVAPSADGLDSSSENLRASDGLSSSAPFNGHPDLLSDPETNHTDYLFESILPINPAIPTTVPDDRSGHISDRVILSHKPESTSMLAFLLNPALYTPKSITDHHLTCPSTFKADDLFSSQLPINPAMHTPPESLPDREDNRPEKASSVLESGIPINSSNPPYATDTAVKPIFYDGLPHGCANDQSSHQGKCSL
ncbi:hypothetical protein VTO42DRAFT_7643 [Malbranchea cinnamomea]